MLYSLSLLVFYTEGCRGNIHKVAKASYQIRCGFLQSRQLTPPCHFSSPLDALEKFHAGSWGKKLLLGNKGQKSVLFKGHS
jgi:hypothetical protein